MVLQKPRFPIFPVLKELNKMKKKKKIQVIQQNPNIFFDFSLKLLPFLSLYPARVGNNTNLPSNSNISETIRVNTAFTGTFFKEHLISFLMVCRFIDFALVVPKLLIFKSCGVIGVPKIEFSNISGTERVNDQVIKCLTNDTDKFITKCNWLFQNKFVSCIMRWRHSESFYADTMRSVRKHDLIFALYGNKMTQLLLKSRADLKLSRTLWFATILHLTLYYALGLAKKLNEKPLVTQSKWLWFFLKFYFR